MRVVIRALVFASLLPLLANNYFAQSLSDSRPEVKICAILPVTGSISFYGVGFKDSALLALKISKVQSIGINLFLKTIRVRRLHL